MLSHKDLQLCIRFIRIFNAVGLLQLRINPNGTIMHCKSLFDRIRKALFCANELFYTGYFICRMVQIVMTGTEKNFYLFPFHGILILGTLAINAWFVQLFYWHEDTTYKVYNDLIKRLRRETSDRLNVKHLIIRHIPILLLLAAQVVLGVYYLVPMAPPFVYSVIKPSNLFSMTLTRMYEMYTVHGWVSVVTFTTTFLLTFMENTQAELAATLEALKSANNKGKRITMTHELAILKRIRLRTIYFNEACSGLVYTLKMACLSMSILGLSCAIKFARNRPMMAGPIAVIAIYTWVLYVLAFSQAFKLPMTLEANKAELKICVSKFSRQVSLMEREIRALTKVAISMGGFHELERSSALLFLQYVSTSVFSIILSFPGEW